MTNRSRRSRTFLVQDSLRSMNATAVKDPFTMNINRWIARWEGEGGALLPAEEDPNGRERMHSANSARAPRKMTVAPTRSLRSTASPGST
jgi:hypothetical protein